MREKGSENDNDEEEEEVDEESKSIQYTPFKSIHFYVLDNQGENTFLNFYSDQL